ncbi:uncharacterized protein DS421_11g324830 [Arachis hypogaea]|nr:uncharacterized protein DS421_11g324830 [Arachis hypogaea]
MTTWGDDVWWPKKHGAWYDMWRDRGHQHRMVTIEGDPDPQLIQDYLLWWQEVCTVHFFSGDEVLVELRDAAPSANIPSVALNHRDVLYLPPDAPDHRRCSRKHVIDYIYRPIWKAWAHEGCQHNKMCIWQMRRQSMHARRRSQRSFQLLPRRMSHHPHSLLGIRRLLLGTSCQVHPQ